MGLQLSGQGGWYIGIGVIPCTYYYCFTPIDTRYDVIVIVISIIIIIIVVVVMIIVVAVVGGGNCLYDPLLLVVSVDLD